MVIKLKSSIRFEIFLVVLWILWSILYSVSTNFFSGMELLYGRLYMLVRACVIGGILGCVILGVVLLWSTINYMVSIWSVKDHRSILLDRIPCEILLIVAVFLWYECMHGETFEGGMEYFWFDPNSPSLYYFLYDFLQSLNGKVIRLGVLWLVLWLVMRQICYHLWMNTSLIQKIYMRYHLASGLGRKITKKRWLLWGLWIASLAFASGSLLCAYNWEPETAAVCFILFLLCQFGILGYQYFSGVIAEDVTALVEQIQAISHAESLKDTFRISERSLFYEPFHQLEELDEAVRRSAEKQLQVERLKIDLITNVSHDLKTPLTSMVGYTDLLKQEKLSAEAKDYVDIISVKQEQLKEMIQQLFELSKATSGVEQLNLETLDMRKLMEQILGDMEDRIKESGQIIRSRFDELPLLFTGDNEKMYRVVQNLLENALKYSLEGTRIYIDVKKREGRIVLQMKNIASYEMDFAADEIMERFVRGDQSRTTEGHGLGLAIASSFTQNMGGFLNVDIDGDLFKVTMEFPAVIE